MVAIKKIYIAGFFTFVSGVFGYSIILELYKELLVRGPRPFLTGLIFLFSLSCAIYYWSGQNLSVKNAREVAKEISGGDLAKQQEIEKHLIKRVINEAYTLDFGIVYRLVAKLLNRG